MIKIKAFKTAGRLKALLVYENQPSTTIINGYALRARQVLRILDRAGFQVETLNETQLKDRQNIGEEDLALIVILNLNLASRIVRKIRTIKAPIWLDAIDGPIEMLKTIGFRLEAIKRIPYLLLLLLVRSRFTLVTLNNFNSRQASINKFVKGQYFDLPLSLEGIHFEQSGISNQKRVIMMADFSYPPNRSAAKFISKRVAKRVGEDVTIELIGSNLDLDFSVHKRVRLSGYTESLDFLKRDNVLMIAGSKKSAGPQSKVLLSILTGNRVLVHKNSKHIYPKSFTKIEYVKGAKEFAREINKFWYSRSMKKKSLEEALLLNCIVSECEVVFIEKLTAFSRKGDSGLSR